MSDAGSEIYDTVKAYILKEFLPGEDPEALTGETPLISGGILDSISTVKLVTFLEGKYNVEFQAHEISTDHLETLTLISSIVQSKMAGGP